MGGVARPFSEEALLKRDLRKRLYDLGFRRDGEGDLVLPGAGKDVIRLLHRGQRRERLAASKPFLDRSLAAALPSFANGCEVDPARISLRLRPVKGQGPEASLFRVASLTWSVPVSAGFGRRMRYLVWDEGHDRLAGIVALGDPVYNLAVRDDLIGWSVADRSERLIGILDAYVLGAVPPYNMLLAGKAIACMLRSRDVYDDFARSYGTTVGVISGRAKRANLLAVTTSSSMGRSSTYNRLRLGGSSYFDAIGFTEGWGHFHINDALFDRFRAFLRARNHGYADRHMFGQGPNWRLRTIRAALGALGYNENVLRHGIRRQVFLARLASNAFELLRDGGGKPDLSDLRRVEEISDLALRRWIVPRAERDGTDFRAWRADMIPRLIQHGAIEGPRLVRQIG